MKISTLLLLLLSSFAWAKNNLPAEINKNDIVFSQCNNFTLKYALVIKIAEIAWYSPDCKENPILGSMNKILRFHYHKNVKSDFFKESAEEFFLKNLDDYGPELVVDLKQFNEGYTSIKPGEYFQLEHFDNSEISLYKNDDLLASSNNQKLAVNYFNIWFGKDPVIDKLKKAFN